MTVDSESQWHEAHDCEDRFWRGIAWALAPALILWAGIAGAITGR